MNFLKTMTSKMLDRYFEDMNFSLPITFESFKNATPSENPYKGNNIVNAYQNSNWVYACVREISENISTLPVSIRNKETFETVTDSEVGKLLQYINSISNKTDFFATIAAYLELRGECVIIKDGMSVRNKMPKSLHIKDPIQFDYNLTEDGTRIKSWTYTYYDKNGAQKEKEFDVKNIIFMRYFNPYHPIRGLAPLEAARNSVMEEFRSKQYNIKFLENDAAVSGVLQTQGNIQDSVFKRLKEEIKQKYAGSHNAGNMLILEGGLEYKQIALSHKDMQYLESRKMTREEICSVFRVPPPVVGIFEYANYANSEQSYISFWTKTLLPKIKFIEEVLNKYLFAEHEPDNFMVFDITEVPVIQALLSKKMDTAIKMRNVGYPLQIIDEKLNIDFLKDYDLDELDTTQGDNTLQVFSSDKQVAIDNLHLLQHGTNEIIDSIFDEYATNSLDFLSTLKSKSFADLGVYDLVFDAKNAGSNVQYIVEYKKDDIINNAERSIVEAIEEPFYLSYGDVDKYFSNVLGYNDIFYNMLDEINSVIYLSYQKDNIADESEILNIIYGYRNKVQKLLDAQLHYIFNACQYESMKINNIHTIKWETVDINACRGTHANLHNTEVELGMQFKNGEKFPLENSDLSLNSSCRCIILPKMKKSG